jgi:nucleoside-diphosphate-sugar epimerase
MCLDLHSQNEKVRGYVLATGIIYGMGERQLLTLFKQAILQNPEELTIIGDGKNSIPMIHISDLSQVIEEIVFSKP